MNRTARHVERQLPIDVRESALRRVLDFYTHTAHNAQRLLYSHRDPVRLDPPTSDVHPHLLPDAPAAWAWLDTEHLCLLAAQHTATIHHWHPTVWYLASSLHTFHLRRGHRHNQITTATGRHARALLEPRLGPDGWATLLDEVRTGIRRWMGTSTSLRTPAATWLVTALHDL